MNQTLKSSIVSMLQVGMEKAKNNYYQGVCCPDSGSGSIVVFHASMLAG